MDINVSDIEDFDAFDIECIYLDGVYRCNLALMPSD